MYSCITIQVNGHNVKVTTDQGITPAWIAEMIKHCEDIEAGRK